MNRGSEGALARLTIARSGERGSVSLAEEKARARRSVLFDQGHALSGELRFQSTRKLSLRAGPRPSPEHHTPVSSEEGLSPLPRREQVAGPLPALTRMLGLRILPAAFSAVQK